MMKILQKILLMLILKTMIQNKKILDYNKLQEDDALKTINQGDNSLLEDLDL